MTNEELYTLFRSQTKYERFTVFLDNINEFLKESEKTCDFCSTFCGNEWCIVSNRKGNE